MAESVTGVGASALTPTPHVSPVTDTSNATCEWCESTEDVQPRNGEALCIDCRASIDFMNILSTQDEV